MTADRGNRVDSPHREELRVPNFKYVFVAIVYPQTNCVERPSDIIIAVMGITGCGKTTFVNLFAEEPLEVGHGLDSCKSYHIQCIFSALNVSRHGISTGGDL